MIIPLSLWKGATCECWHICDNNGALCGAALSDISWCLPDAPTIQLDLCLECWDEVAISYVQMKENLDIACDLPCGEALRCCEWEKST